MSIKQVQSKQRVPAQAGRSEVGHPPKREDRPPEALLALAQRASTRALSRTSVGGTEPPPSPGAPSAPADGIAGAARGLYFATAPAEAPAGPRPRRPAPFGTVVDDGVPIGEGQIARSAFLDRVSAEVTAAAEKELAKVGRTAADCPYLVRWLAYYRGRPAADIERAVERYATPERTDPDGLIKAVVSRARRAVGVWAQTGKIVGFGNTSPMPSPPGEADRGPAGSGRGTTPPLTKQLEGSSPAAPLEPASVQRSLGSGRPLDSAIRGRIEPGFGRSFADVRVHTDSVAARLATSLSARAFTIGADVGFGAGQYHPGTLAGDLLIAHELAHVIQQDGANGSTASIGDGTFAQLEREADESALAVLAHRNGRVRPGAAPGLRLQRCGDDVDFSKLAEKPDYETTLWRLSELYAQKEDIQSGDRDFSELESVNAQIAEQIAQLRILGIALDEDEIYRRVTDVAHLPGTQSMQTVWGKIVRTPQGPAYIGQRLTFQFVPDYLPPESNVQVSWYYRATADRTFGEGPMHGGTNPMTAVPANRGMGVTLAERFWTKDAQKPFIEQIEKRGGLVPIAVVHPGNAAAVEIPGDFVPLASSPPKFEVEIVPAVPMPNTGVTLRIKDWAPLIGRFVVVWSYDEKDLGPALLKEYVQVGSAGAHTFTGKLYKAKGADEALTPVGDPIAIDTKKVEVRERQAIGEQVMAEAAKLQKPPKLAELEASINLSMQEIAKRGVLGGEREAYWQERYKSQQKRLERIGELAPGHKTSKDLPTDLSTLDDSMTYASAIPAVIVYGGVEGTQPISVYLTARKAGNQWSARLLDVTGKVVKFDGTGATALDAFKNAFETWKSDNPYPTGGLVVYNFSPTGWTFQKSFSTTTNWKSAKEWVDSILAVGGMVVGALLLLAPEATITKVAGLALLGLAVARSGVGIYERLQLGSEVLDKENVLDGIVIITSLMGLGGGVLRSLGAEARALSSAPLVYRVGSWMVVTTLAADVGTLVYLTADAMAQLRAARGDPTMDDSQRTEMVLRVVSSLLLQGIMIFVSNRDLFRGGLKASDFVKTRLPTTETVSLSKGMRLDIELELRKAGAEPGAVKGMGERELLSNFLIVQRRQKAIGGIEKLRAALSADAQAEFDAARLRHDSVDSFAAEVEKHADPKQHFEDLAAQKKSSLAVAPPGPAGTSTTLMGAQVDRMARLHPASKLAPAPDRPLQPRAEGSGFIAGPDAQVRINGEADIHPSKLAAMSDADVTSLLKGTHDLATHGGDITKVAKPTRDALKELASRERIRFQYQLREADEFLTRLGLRDERIFKNLSDFDKERLYTVLGTADPAGAPNLMKLAADYALSRKPASPREFANHLEFFRAEFMSRGRSAQAAYAARLDAAVAAFEATAGKKAGEADVRRFQSEESKKAFGKEVFGTGPKFKEAAWAKLESEMSKVGDTSKLRPEAARSVGAVYENLVKSLGGRVGAVSIEPNLSDADLVAKVKGLPEVKFGSPDAATYHALKHSGELPPTEIGTDIMRGFLDAAQKTIKNPSADPSPVMLQNGARSITFVREVSEGGVKYPVRAVVIVSREGNVVLATVMGKQK